jgi:hypothetical protein
MAARSEVALRAPRFISESTSLKWIHNTDQQNTEISDCNSFLFPCYKNGMHGNLKRTKNWEAVYVHCTFHLWNYWRGFDKYRHWFVSGEQDETYYPDCINWTSSTSAKDSYLQAWLTDCFLMGETTSLNCYHYRTYCGIITMTMTMGKSEKIPSQCHLSTINPT